MVSYLSTVSVCSYILYCLLLFEAARLRYPEDMRSWRATPPLRGQLVEAAAASRKVKRLWHDATIPVFVDTTPGSPGGVEDGRSSVGRLPGPDEPCLGPCEAGREVISFSSQACCSAVKGALATAISQRILSCVLDRCKTTVSRKPRTTVSCRLKG